MHDRKAAVRFARAFFYDAQQRDAVEQAGRELALLGECVRRVPELIAFLAHPLVPAETKRDLCREQLGQFMALEQLSFLDLLIERERAALLPAAIGNFQVLVDDWARVIRAQVWTAVPLTPEEQERLRQAVAAAFDGAPVLSLSVEPGLVGGVVVRVKDTVLDGSLRTALRLLSADLKAGAAPLPTGGEAGPGD
jgi:F-type H+-transporting ATPase subunit delta